MLLVLLLGLLSWPRRSLRPRTDPWVFGTLSFVVAAHTLGASHARIMLRHVLPNVVPFVCTLAAIDVGGLTLLESALSFLGLGIQPPLPARGNMLNNVATSFSRGPWLVYCPALAVSLTVCACASSAMACAMRWTRGSGGGRRK